MIEDVATFNIEEFEVPRESIQAIENAARRMSRLARQKIIDLAFETLPASLATQYALGVEELSPEKIIGGFGYVELSGVALEIEEGAPPFDIKAGLLASPKAKTGKGGGKYIDVPIAGRSTGVSISGSPVLAAMGIRSPVARNQPRSALPQAKDVELPSGGQDVYVHKVGLNEGLVTHQRVMGHEEHVKFRRVSDRSDPASWIYPRRDPANLLAELNAEMDALRPRILIEESDRAWARQR